jgi:hypothetical protein
MSGAEKLKGRSMWWYAVSKKGRYPFFFKAGNNAENALVLWRKCTGLYKPYAMAGPFWNRKYASAAYDSSGRK